MAALMGNARYEWTTERHLVLWSRNGRSKGKRDRHMVDLGAHLCLDFSTRDNLTNCAARARDHSIRVVSVEPWHELERLARKAFIDPPPLGGA